MARVVWIVCREDWRAAGVPVSVSRERFLDFELPLAFAFVFPFSFPLAAGDVVLV